MGKVVDLARRRQAPSYPSRWRRGLAGRPGGALRGACRRRVEHQPGPPAASADIIGGCHVAGRVTLVRRTGWHDVGGHRVFVLPAETIGPAGAEPAILDAAATGPYEARGTLKDWQAGVGALAAGHALPVLARSAALAGVLLDLSGQEGGGVNIFGDSLKGKTTIFQAAASVWGRGASPGYVRSWRQPRTDWKAWPRAHRIPCLFSTSWALWKRAMRRRGSIRYRTAAARRGRLATALCVSRRAGGLWSSRLASSRRSQACRRSWP